jgi:hypothetical protein
LQLLVLVMVAVQPWLPPVLAQSMSRP